MRRGNCYVTCEALYHLLGGKEAGYVPHTVQHEGDTHWYLVHRKKLYTELPGLDGEERVVYGSTVIDPTASQFRTPVPYHEGRGTGFLTREPSKRAREMMEEMLWQREMSSASSSRRTTSTSAARGTTGTSRSSATSPGHQGLPRGVAAAGEATQGREKDPVALALDHPSSA